jgi:hypothetical protein
LLIMGHTLHSIAGAIERWEISLDLSVNEFGIQAWTLNQQTTLARSYQQYHTRATIFRRG